MRPSAIYTHELAWQAPTGANKQARMAGSYMSLLR